ncbi:MAG: hypothetical protein RBS43_04905 [Candidatus Cloacimonas sp.]|jgi:hypothetical protein|nr:hypothetical protein [Candidatus Cloacimonas sp.]
MNLNHREKQRKAELGREKQRKDYENAVFMDVSLLFSVVLNRNVQIFSILHENEYSATLGERKKAPTITWVNFDNQWRKRSFHSLFSAFLCFSLWF